MIKSNICFRSSTGETTHFVQELTPFSEQVAIHFSLLVVHFVAVSAFFLHFKRSFEVRPSLAAGPSSHPGLDRDSSIHVTAIIKILQLLLDYFTVIKITEII